MKKLLLLLLLISNLSFAQDFSGKSTQELQILKTQAVSDENYELAGKINTEIKKRKENDNSINTIEINLKKELAIALKNEDYDNASIIKKKLSRIDEYKSYDKIILAAVNNEDYATAAEYKKLKTELENEIKSNSTTTSQTTSFIKNTTITSNEKGSFVFQLTGHRTLLYDVLIDDKYYGTITGNQTLVVKDVPNGNHQVCVVWDMKYKQNVLYSISNGQIKKISVNYDILVEEASDFNKFYKTSLIQKTEIPSEHSSILFSEGVQMDFSTIKTESYINTKNKKEDGTYLYETQQLGIGGIFSGFILPIKWQIMNPLFKDVGISYGYEVGAAVSSGFEDFYYEVSGMIGYKYETDFYSPYVSYNLGLGSFNNNIGVLSRLNLGCEFFLTELGSDGIGLHTEYNYGLFVGGGSTITLGLVWRTGRSSF